MSGGPSICVFLCGDVMTGRGVDQVLAHPSDPMLHESYLRDARQYVELAELVSGPIARPCSATAIWGAALEELRRRPVDARIVNLETSITTSNRAWPGKGIHYRMHPANISCLTAAGIDACALANNHVLDWGYEGLAETIEVLQAAALAFAGAGRDAAQAAQPAVLAIAGVGRILLTAAGLTSSGIPPDWQAAPDRPGVHLLPDLSPNCAKELADTLHQHKKPGDIAIASLHWGSNWGYDIPAEHIAFAHQLIDSGVDLVFGHSSHHVRSLEIYRGKLILYGCGDFINDYEGIASGEEFRPDLRVMYLVRLDAATGQLRQARLVPLQARGLCLHRAGPADARWLTALLDSQGREFRNTVRLESDDSILCG